MCRTGYSQTRCPGLFRIPPGLPSPAAQSLRVRALPIAPSTPPALLAFTSTAERVCPLQLSNVSPREQAIDPCLVQPTLVHPQTNREAGFGFTG